MDLIPWLRVKPSTFYRLITFYIGLFINQSLVLIQQLCAVLNVNKRSVDRDLDVYRNLLSKLVQAKELLKEYVDR